MYLTFVSCFWILLKVLATAFSPSLSILHKTSQVQFCMKVKQNKTLHGSAGQLLGFVAIEEYLLLGQIIFI